ncbi:MAG: glutamate--cysteine ligase, partial [Pseudomonadota bacterium]|nr:glutamate--cysteine ligase [Pseudomonadota bacterium]
MGVNITKGEFKTGDLAASESALQSNLRTLAGLLNNPEFGHLRAGRPALGAELEMYIVDGDGQPLGINEALVADADDPLLSLELNRYNLEYNLRPYSFSDAAFEATERDMLQQLARLNQLAEQRGGQVLPIGILPTLKPSHFGPSMLTPQQRYVSLVKQLSRNRGEQFRIHIDGLQPLRVAMPDVTLEGANTSFQIHYRVEPQRFADMFNAFQLVTPLVVAVAANSPGLFEHDLWHETRIPLFKQSIDARVKGRYSWQEPARVNFGHGWVRDSALELFQEIVN